MGILAAAAFEILSATNRLKVYSAGQLVFGRDMIIPIKHMMDWELIRQRNQTQINKDNIRENRKRLDHGYKVRDKVMLNNHAVYKYGTLFKVPFVIKRCWTNVTVTLQYGSTKIRHNIRWIKPYKYDTNVEYINPQNMFEDFNI